MVPRSILLLLIAVALAAAQTPAGDGWKRVDEEHGIVVDAREVPSSSLREVRASIHSALPPATIAAVVWRYEDHDRFVPRLAHAEVVREVGPDERIVYEQLALPLLKDRDVVLRARRETAADGTIDIRTTAIDGEGPPPTSRFVRVQTSAGHWHLAPAAGGTDLVYDIRTDVGGAVPAWIVNRAQREAVPDLVKAMLDRAGSR
jgi:hypothetical protein